MWLLTFLIHFQLCSHNSCNFNNKVILYDQNDIYFVCICMRFIILTVALVLLTLETWLPQNFAWDLNIWIIKKKTKREKLSQSLKQDCFFSFQMHCDYFWNIRYLPLTLCHGREWLKLENKLNLTPFPYDPNSNLSFQPVLHCLKHFPPSSFLW